MQGMQLTAVAARGGGEDAAAGSRGRLGGLGFGADGLASAKNTFLPFGVAV